MASTGLVDTIGNIFSSICTYKFSRTKDLTTFRNKAAPLEATDPLDNNVAELWAALMAIRIAKQIFGKVFSTPCLFTLCSYLFW